MFRYFVRRLLQGVLTFFGATFIVYALMFANQDDPLQALAGEKPLAENVRQVLTERYHLDEPFLAQYGHYMRGLLHLDFGISLTERKISDMMAQAWPVTIRLAIMAAIISAVVALTAGIISGIRRGGPFDTTTLIITLLLLSLPIVVLAPLAQTFFAVQLGWFPATSGAEPGFYKLLLPALVLSCLVIATQLRVTRASVAENLRSDYVRTARAKGLANRRVIGVHVLRNSLIPVVTLIGVDLGSLMAGAIVTESVFNIPGVGFNLARGIRTEDGPLVVGFVSILVIVFILVNLVVDLLYAVLDPRIRYE